MIIDAGDLSRRQAYRLLISSIVPRPIAWVSTCAADGTGNLAPFSFFMGVAADPPTLALAIGRRRGELKDTARNIVDTGEFVVNVVTIGRGADMVRSSADVGPQVDEFELCGLERAPSVRVRPPRLADAPVAMECVLVDTHAVGRSPTTLVLGEVVCFHVDDRLWRGDDVDPHGLAPLGRMGDAFYAPIRNAITIERPVIDPDTGRPRD